MDIAQLVNRAHCRNRRRPGSSPAALANHPHPIQAAMSRPPAKFASAPLPSRTQGIADALAHSEPLVMLTRRIRDSQARLAAISALLPEGLRAQVRAGPIDEAGWTLLTANSAVSAKLRQLVPALEAHLRTQGWDGPPVRVKLLNPA